MDEFTRFQLEMAKRSAEAATRQADDKRRDARGNEQERRDVAVISAMRDMPLKRGQMLLLGPKSVAVLSGMAVYEGKFPDKHMLERDEWQP